MRLAEDLDRDAVRYQGNWIPHKLRAATEDGDLLRRRLGRPLPAADRRGDPDRLLLRDRLRARAAAGRRGPGDARDGARRYGAFSARHEWQFRWLLRVQRLVPRVPPRLLALALRGMSTERVRALVVRPLPADRPPGVRAGAGAAHRRAARRTRSPRPRRSPPALERAVAALADHEEGPRQQQRRRPRCAAPVIGVCVEAEDPQPVDDDRGRELAGDRRGGHAAGADRLDRDQRHGHVGGAEQAARPGSTSGRRTSSESPPASPLRPTISASRSSADRERDQRRGKLPGGAAEPGVDRRLEGQDPADERGEQDCEPRSIATGC